MSDDLRTMLKEFSAACHEADRINNDTAKLRAFEIQQALLALPSPQAS